MEIGKDIKGLKTREGAITRIRKGCEKCNISFGDVRWLVAQNETGYFPVVIGSNNNRDYTTALIHYGICVAS